MNEKSDKVPSSQLNLFRDQEGAEYAIGFVNNKQGDRFGMWYMGGSKKVYLHETKLVKLKVLPAKGTSPKAVVWSYADISKTFKVTLNLNGTEVTRIFYCRDAADVKNRALFWASKEYVIPINRIHYLVRTNPSAYHAVQIE